MFSQAETMGKTRVATLTMVKVDGTAPPNLRVNFDADRPYDINRNGPSKKPQIVALVQKKLLYIGWQGWNGRGPTNKILVHKIGTDALEQNKLTPVRDTPS